MNSAVWGLGQFAEDAVHDMEEHSLSAVSCFAVFVKRLEILFDRRQRQETNHFLKAVKIIYIVFYVHFLLFRVLVFVQFFVLVKHARVVILFGA